MMSSRYRVASGGLPSSKVAITVYENINEDGTLVVRLADAGPRVSAWITSEVGRTHLIAELPRAELEKLHVALGTYLAKP